MIDLIAIGAILHFCILGYKIAHKKLATSGIKGKLVTL